MLWVSPWKKIWLLKKKFAYHWKFWTYLITSLLFDTFLNRSFNTSIQCRYHTHINVYRMTLRCIFFLFFLSKNFDFRAMKISWIAAHATKEIIVEYTEYTLYFNCELKKPWRSDVLKYWRMTNLITEILKSQWFC